MKTLVLIGLCLLLAFSAAQALANAGHEDRPASPLVSTNTFLPLVGRLANVDLTITRLEISQAIQTPQQSVPLVVNRPTIVRAYLQAIADHAITGVTLSFAATRLGAPLPGSPLIWGPVTAPLAPAQENYASTVNVSLPSAWLSGNVTLTVTADPSGAIREVNEANNQRLATLAFNSVPPMDLKIVPINYHDTRTGKYHPAVSTDPVSEFVRRTFPLSGINVSYHAPIDFFGDLSQTNDWIQLLYVITNLKISEGEDPSQVYYGLVPTWGSYFNIGGIGWVGYRAAVGLDNLTTVGAHEIGHTFGRQHAPCGNPAEPDPSYPYPGASIGNYGIDVYSNHLVSPVSPDYAVDLMSYCSPPWVSDYTYIGLYNDQRAQGLAEAPLAPAQVLLVRVRFNGSGAPELLPVYSLSGVADEAITDSEYAVEIFGLTGERIASYPVRRYETSDLDPPAFAIYAAVPQSAQPISKIRLAHAGEVLAERSLGVRVSPRAALQALDLTENAMTLAWGDPGAPALVRYSTGENGPWTTLGVDILGGRLSIDRSLLPGGELHFEVIPADTGIPTRHTLDVSASE